MLTDKQSLVLCGLMACGVFVFGILDILNNFVSLTILSIIFFAIVANIIAVKSFSKNKEDLNESKHSS